MCYILFYTFNIVANICMQYAQLIYDRIINDCIDMKYCTIQNLIFLARSHNVIVVNFKYCYKQWYSIPLFALNIMGY